MAAPAALGGWIDFMAPLTVPAGATEMRRVVYGTAGAGGRDLAAWVHGRADTSERRPGLVFVHGGGWAGGSPAFHIRHAHLMAGRGWVTMNVSYRLTAEAP